jgi:hypothetical protein
LWGAFLQVLEKAAKAEHQIKKSPSGGIKINYVQQPSRLPAPLTTAPLTLPLNAISNIH